MISLASLIGQEITAYIPAFHPTKWQKVKLLNVEASGIWVESKEIQEFALAGTGLTASPKTAAFFLPFSSVVLVMASLDVPYLSDRMLP